MSENKGLIKSEDCPVYLRSQGKKWSPYITPDQYPCEKCPLDCKERKQKRLDRPELIADALGCGECVALQDCLSGKPFKACSHSSILPKLVAPIPDIEAIKKQYYIDLDNMGGEIEEAKKQERERIGLELQQALSKETGKEGFNEYRLSDFIINSASKLCKGQVLQKKN